METKQCTGCCQELPFSSFTPKKGSKDGVCPRCRDCINALRRLESKQRYRNPLTGEENGLEENTNTQNYHGYGLNKRT